MVNRQKLRVVFIGYWGINDSLTKATILPWLDIMEASDNVEKVILCTIERDTNQPFEINSLANYSKAEHHPLYSINKGTALFTKVNDFILFPKAIYKVAKAYKATTLFAHGSPAGALAYKVWRRTKLPFYVSLFEPHAAYMAESGVWKRNGLKYISQRYWESMQKKHATGLFPVTENYRQQLILEGINPAKIKTVACTIVAKTFAFNNEARANLRTRLGWQDATIGVYAGKYGGLYFYDEAFQIYKKCFELIPFFRLIILSPHPTEVIHTLLRQQNIDINKVITMAVSNQEVPAYLSASDFAFATYKPGKSKKYLSPVKIGEYWANGLPVLLTQGVGDDSDIIAHEGGGALFNLKQEGSIEKAISQIIGTIKNPKHRQEIPKLAEKYRSPGRIKEAFDYFVGHNKRVDI